MGALSVVIPTYNRRERLGRVLRSLEEQSVDADTFEVVVIDDGSTDQTAEWLGSQRFRFPLRVVRQANSGPAAARNAGVEAAANPIVLFLDDDVVPSPGLVREHLGMHEAERDICVLGPLSSLSSYRQPWVAWEQAKLEAQYQAMIRGDYAPSFRQFWTGNASVAREHVRAAGGFDTGILRGEDIELGLRLARRGVTFRFNPRAGGLHHAERSLTSWCHAHSSYGKLEVQVFGTFRLGNYVEVLRDNFGRLHPLSRIVVRGMVGRRIPLAALTASLRGYLRISEVVPVRPLSNAACGLLANLLYWSASAEALSKGAVDRIFHDAPASPETASIGPKSDQLPSSRGPLGGG
jgi:glycosyltransferase involved in cell wall biosynthesis